MGTVLENKRNLREYTGKLHLAPAPIIASVSTKL